MEWSEVEGPDPVIDFLESDVFFEKRVADVDPAPFPSDVAVLADAADLEVAGVLRFREPIGIGPWRGSVEVGGRFLIEVFMRALVVVLVTKSLEAPLLRSAPS